MAHTGVGEGEGVDDGTGVEEGVGEGVDETITVIKKR